MRLPSLAAAVLAACALLTASCGSSTEPQPAPTTTAPAAGHGSYASCLAEHGVQAPPIGPGAPSGVDPQTWAQAQQACADKAPGPVS